MSRPRLLTLAVVLAIVSVLALPPSGSRDLQPKSEEATLVLFAQDGQQEGFTLNDFAEEFKRRVPEPAEATPSQIKRAARQTAKKFENEADQRITIDVEVKCCPVEIIITIRW